ncbi:hypothetical protein H310_07902 [Aphanomyces invadans]|uniref:CKK domain-containing protein n=1 Tax=Aphanomyces invadans TaxID=157072 RepID=A0A024U2N8_9STRA|nr:hypothetical protein H310_07902 [Aphanomyces invadans]ETV99867.1 hypothetical protein H310_07902 [Aphanomyces invadans]|eukprot:XP_008871643.1 hypothetical protein H310_07902 [Aphanomyces invadans]
MHKPSSKGGGAPPWTRACELGACASFAASVIRCGNTVDLLRKDKLQAMVVEAHHRGLTSTLTCMHDVGDVADLHVRHGGATWELEGTINETLLTDLFELDRRLLGQPSAMCVCTATKAMVVAKIDRKILLYVCPGKIKVVKGMDELLEKVVDETGSGDDMAYTLSVLFSTPPGHHPVRDTIATIALPDQGVHKDISRPVGEIAQNCPAPDLTLAVPECNRWTGHPSNQDDDVVPSSLPKLGRPPTTTPTPVEVHSPMKSVQLKHGHKDNQDHHHQPAESPARSALLSADLSLQRSLRPSVDPQHIDSTGRIAIAPDVHGRAATPLKLTPEQCPAALSPSVEALQNRTAPSTHASDPTRSSFVLPDPESTVCGRPSLSPLRTNALKDCAAALPSPLSAATQVGDSNSHHTRDNSVHSSPPAASPPKPVLIATATSPLRHAVRYHLPALKVVSHAALLATIPASYKSKLGEGVWWQLEDHARRVERRGGRPRAASVCSQSAADSWTLHVPPAFCLCEFASTPRSRDGRQRLCHQGSQDKSTIPSPVPQHRRATASKDSSTHLDTNSLHVARERVPDDDVGSNPVLARVDQVPTSATPYTGHSTMPPPTPRNRAQHTDAAQGESRHEASTTSSPSWCQQLSTLHDGLSTPQNPSLALAQFPEPFEVGAEGGTSPVDSDRSLLVRQSPGRSSSHVRQVSFNGIQVTTEADVESPCARGECAGAAERTTSDPSDSVDTGAVAHCTSGPWMISEIPNATADLSSMRLSVENAHDPRLVQVLGPAHDAPLSSQPAQPAHTASSAKWRAQVDSSELVVPTQPKPCDQLQLSIQTPSKPAEQPYRSVRKVGGASSAPTLSPRGSPAARHDRKDRSPPARHRDVVIHAQGSPESSTSTCERDSLDSLDDFADTAAHRATWSSREVVPAEVRVKASLAPTTPAPSIGHTSSRHKAPAPPMPPRSPPKANPRAPPPEAFANEQQQPLISAATTASSTPRPDSPTAYMPTFMRDHPWMSSTRSTGRAPPLERPPNTVQECARGAAKGISSVVKPPTAMDIYLRSQQQQHEQRVNSVSDPWRSGQAIPSSPRPGNSHDRFESRGGHDQAVETIPRVENEGDKWAVPSAIPPTQRRPPSPLTTTPSPLTTTLVVPHEENSPPPTPPPSPPPKPQSMFVRVVDTPKDRAARLMELREKKLKQLQDRKDFAAGKPSKDVEPSPPQGPLSVGPSATNAKPVVGQFLKPTSNRQLIQNALETNLLAGTACDAERARVVQALLDHTADNFVVTFKGSVQEMKMTFKGLYALEKEYVHKIYGQGPAQLQPAMVKQFFRYNSGKKAFLPVSTRSFTIKTDGAALADDCFRKKKMDLF